MKVSNKMIFVLGMLLLIGNIVYLSVKYQATFEPTFSEEALKKNPVFQKHINETVNTVQSKANTLPADVFSQGATENAAEVFENFYTNIESPDIFRIKVWDKNYTVIWSNAPGLIGRQYLDNHEVQESLEGKVEIEVKKGKSEHYTERAYANYAEVYIPIKDASGRVVGVFETYRVTEDVISRLRAEFYTALIKSIIGSFVIILVFVGIRAFIH